MSQPLPLPASQPDYVSPVPGTGVVYAIVADRKKFDQIDRPVTQHEPLPDGRRCMSKTIGNWSMASNEGLVIFQHWLDAPTSQPSNPEAA